MAQPRGLSWRGSSSYRSAVRLGRPHDPLLSADPGVRHRPAAYSVLPRALPLRAAPVLSFLYAVLGWQAVSTPTPGAWAAPLILGALYYRAALREEQKFAHSDLAPDYDAYRRQAGMFLPRLSAFCRGEKESSRFLKKAAPKTFVMPGHGLCQRQRPWLSIIKFFCYFLFTKSSAYFLPCLSLTPEASLRPPSSSTARPYARWGPHHRQAGSGNRYSGGDHVRFFCLQRVELAAPQSGGDFRLHDVVGAGERQHRCASFGSTTVNPALRSRVFGAVVIFWPCCSEHAAWYATVSPARPARARRFSADIRKYPWRARRSSPRRRPWDRRGAKTRNPSKPCRSRTC